jgi:hypothetical protein
MLDLRSNTKLWRFLIPTTDKPTYYINELRRFLRFFPIPDDQTGTALNIAITSLLNRLDRNAVTVIEARDMLIEALDAVHAMRPHDFVWRQAVRVTIDGIQYNRPENMIQTVAFPESHCTCKEYPFTVCTATFHPGVI